GRQVEERVAGEHVVTVGDQPVVELALLLGQRVQLVPHIGPAAGRAQPGDAQGRAVVVGQRLELVELGDVVAGHHHRDLRVLEPGVLQVPQGAGGQVERAGTAHGVVDLGGGAVERDLHVDVVGGGQARGDLLVDAHTVGGELHAHLVGRRVVDQFPEVRAHGRLTAADVDVEHLHGLELVDHGLALLGGQLVGVAPARGGQ